MIENIYGKNLREYEYIKGEDSKETDKTILILTNIMKCLFFLIFACVLYFFLSSLFSYLQPDQTLEKRYQESIRYFNDIFPKIQYLDMSYSTVVTKQVIKDFFRSRILYINDKNITNEYINFIRPINEKEDEEYNQILYKNILYNEVINDKKEGQMNYKDFFNLVNTDRLIDSLKIIVSDEPKISIIIPIQNSNYEIIRTINSIKNQTFKDLEIIIVDDFAQNHIELLNYLFKTEPSIRIFRHIKKMGLWRTRLDGFLYSRGKYILHMDPGDILADNYVLEDNYRLLTKYNLDTIRFSFSNVIKNNNLIEEEKFDNMKIYPTRHLKILYGRPDYDVHEYGYGTIWNRLIRGNLFLKGFDLVDINILNAYKDIWEDRWWNDLIDRVSFSNLIVNKLGYINFENRNIIDESKIKNPFEKNNIIQEFILDWYFDYTLIPYDGNKTDIITTLNNYNQPNNTYNNIPININYLTIFFPIYKHFLITLFKDPFIPNSDKDLIKELYTKSPRPPIKSYKDIK